MFLNTDTNGPVGSNTDSGSKIGVQSRDITIRYILLLLLETYFKRDVHKYIGFF